MSEINNLPIKTERSKLFDVTMVLSMLAFMSVYYYGFYAVLIIFSCVVSSFACDIIINLVRKIPHTLDNFLFVINISLTIALMMTASTEIYIAVIASIFAVFIGKQAFGGRENLLFYPSAIAVMFVNLSFKEELLTSTKQFATFSETLNPISENSLLAVTNMSNITSEFADISLIDVIVGRFISPIGSGFLVILIVGAIFLMFRKSLSIIAFAIPFFGVFLYGFFYYGNDVFSAVKLMALNSMFFGLMFFGCCDEIVPKGILSKVFYGTFLGILTIIFTFYLNTSVPILNAVIIASPFSLEFSKIEQKIISRKNERKNKTKTETEVEVETETEVENEIQTECEGED